MDAVVWNGGRAVGPLSVPGVGMSDCSCVAVACDVVVVGELGELLQADAIKPIANAAATNP